MTIEETGYVPDFRKWCDLHWQDHVTGIDQPEATVIAGSTTGQSTFAVGDPRLGMSRGKGDESA